MESITKLIEDLFNETIALYTILKVNLMSIKHLFYTVFHIDSISPLRYHAVNKSSDRCLSIAGGGTCPTYT